MEIDDNKQEITVILNSKQILINAWDNGRNQKNNKISIRENEKEEVEFLIEIDSDELCKAIIIYSPQPYIDHLIKVSRQTLDVIREQGATTKDVFAAILYFERKLDEIASIIVRNIYREFQNTVEEQGLLAEKIFLEVMPDKIIITENYEITENYDTVVSFLDNIATDRRERRKFFLNEMRAAEIAPQVLFSIFYEGQLQMWNDAKGFHQTNKKKFNNVIELVATAFPALPKDLIERLGLDGMQGIPTPHELALKSTARLVGVPPRTKSHRALQEYLKESQNLKNQMPPKEIREAFNHLLEFFTQRETKKAILSLLDKKESILEISDIEH